MPDLRQVLALMQTLRQEINDRFDDFSNRLDTVNGKYDKLPEQFVLRQEWEPYRAKIERFDEWRTNMLQSQYEKLFQLTNRIDAQANQALRDDLDDATENKRTHHERQFNLNMNLLGWLVALLITVLGLVGPHINIVFR